MATPPTTVKFRFGAFEADLTSGELRKHGIKIKLYDQPFKVLAILLEHPGEVITREQLSQQLWPAGTFVDSDMGLNTAIMKLRDALGDSAENPRFVETLPRRGYRFLGEVVPVRPSIQLAQKEIPLRVVEPQIEPGGAEGTPGTVQGGGVVNPMRAEPEARSVPRWIPGAAFAGFVLLLVVGAWWVTRQKPAPYSIAVLPLQNLSGDPGNDYFSDGLTDEIISNLSIIDGLEVKSRTSSFAFKGVPRDIHQVGAQLNTSLVLEGSVLRSDNKLRINVQLIRVSNDIPLWSGRYDRELKDVFAIQDDISRAIVNELRLKLGGGQRRYNTNLEAYDDYLRAGVLLNITPGYGHNTIEKSIPLFEETIAKDPNFAPAYAGIANAYAYLSVTPRGFSPALAYSKMREACEKALNLDPLLAEAHACMGLVHSRDRDWQGSEKSFRRALELNPNLSAPRQDFAMWVLAQEGKYDEALREARTAVRLDPLSDRARNNVNYILVLDGQYEEALADCRKILARDPGDGAALQLLARILVQQGQIDEGITTLERLGKGSESLLGYAYARAGRRDDAEKIAAQHRDWPWLQALVYAGLGDKDRAYEGLKQMAAIQDPRAAAYLEYPELSILRGDSRREEFRRSLGLSQ
jgi:TolB-like protein/DNA-binding winged helix-turn-helix (wHTH) protein/Flp pilus assembly protein TadD